jgi:hypothetical protein
MANLALNSNHLLQWHYHVYLIDRALKPMFRSNRGYKMEHYKTTYCLDETWTMSLITG